MRCYYECITNVNSIDFNTFSLQMKSYEFFATFRVECRFNNNNTKVGLASEFNYSRDRIKIFKGNAFHKEKQFV